MSASPLVGGSSATILVVDDTPESLRFLTTTLEHAGMTVLIAVDGKAALIGYCDDRRFIERVLEVGQFLEEASIV